MTALSGQQQLALIQATAKQYQLSPATLLGVYGTESAYGTNNGPSSAGALGPFQFLPSTGATYGLTATGTNPTILNFQDSLVAAAKYLKSLGANSSPTSANTVGALNAYNGNSGGKSLTSYVTSVIKNGSPGAAVSGLLSTFPSNGAFPNNHSVVGSGVNAVVGPISSVADAIGWVFTNWLRVLEFLGGAVLGILGLVLLGKAGAKEI